MSSDAADTVEEDASTEEEAKTLDLEVAVDSTSACGRHVTVTVSKKDVGRYFKEAFDELLPKASVPGFREGKAPRKLVESRFKSEINERVKGQLLMDAMTQVTTSADFAAISEPDFDFDAIEVARDEPLKFEFEIEVRPEFDMPNWKGLKLERPTKAFDRKDVDKHLERLLGDVAEMAPVDRVAEAGDFLVVQISFGYEGKVVSECTEEVSIAKKISFPDAVFDGFDKLMLGSKAGDKREATVTISHDAPNEALRGKEVTASIEVLDVMERKLPALDDATLSELGDFDSEGDLRDALMNDLERRLAYHQQKRIRQQITSLLTESANWDLPQDLLRRQSRRELERAVLELRSSNFSEEEIRAYENELRRNSVESTKTALKEHFILERIADDEEIEETQEDYDMEIATIAMQSRESVRRVKARIEKQGMMDALRNQIIERKVIAKIMEAATFKDVPYTDEDNQVTAVDHFVSGAKDTNIPVAKYAGEGDQLKSPLDRD